MLFLRVFNTYVSVRLFSAQHRTRNLVEGYEYIQGLATQLPEMFKETAEQHRKTLQGAIHSLGPEEQAIIAENDEVQHIVICTFYILASPCCAFFFQ